MANVTPLMQRFVDAGIHLPENREYRDIWIKLRDDAGGPPARIVVAVLANLAVHIEKEIRESPDDMPRERRIVLNNDLWLVSDLIEDLIEQINGVPASVDLPG